jgi:hypothetical protein
VGEQNRLKGDRLALFIPDGERKEEGVGSGMGEHATWREKRGGWYGTLTGYGGRPTRGHGAVEAVPNRHGTREGVSHRQVGP